MATTVKITSLALTKSDLAMLEALSKREGESYTQILKRGLILVHYITFFSEKKK